MRVRSGIMTGLQVQSVDLFVHGSEFFFCINFIYLTRITHALKALGVLLNSDIYIYMCTKINHTHIRY